MELPVYLVNNLYHQLLATMAVDPNEDTKVILTDLITYIEADPSVEIVYHPYDNNARWSNVVSTHKEV